MTLSEIVARHAAERGDAPAYVTADDRITWSEYDRWADALAAELRAGPGEPGDRVAVLLADGPAVHVAFLAVERAGRVIVGIGPRAGDREVEHLVGLTGARVLVADADRASLADRLGLTRVDPTPSRRTAREGDGEGDGA